MAKAGRGDDQYMLRFPEGLRDKVKAAAELHGRSMNSEIVARLEASFAWPAQDPERAATPSDYHRAVVALGQKLTDMDSKLESLVDWEKLGRYRGSE